MPFTSANSIGPKALPFITIAQQIGAECFMLPQRLAELLNEREPDEKPWTHWDQELVEKVASQSHIPVDLIANLESSGHSWVGDLLTGISGRVDEVAIFHRLQHAVQELARTGRVILIGHGSTFMTRDLPGGLHIRLIAPAAVRGKNVAERFKLSPTRASRHMRQVDKQRQRFFARFWPTRPLKPDVFTAELNTAELDEQRLAKAILAMLPTPPA